MASYDSVPFTEAVLAADGKAFAADSIEIGTTAEQVAPTVAIVSPPPGPGLQPTTPVVLQVTDNTGKFRRIILMMRFDGTDIEEMVHNGNRFGPKYLGGQNDVVQIAGGFRYTLLRRGGWPANPTLDPYAIDAAGNENA